MKVAVTGAFGYSGRYIARHLLDDGHEVITLTNSIHRQNPFDGRVRAFPFHFDRPELLAGSLKGVDALVNTYWVRFDHRLFTHHQAVENTMVLFRAARDAGVRRIVHTSITNPDPASDLPYFRGKAGLEMELQKLGVAYCILRPTVLFGEEDVLINNIAWGLRRLPVFGVFGSGEYKLQPIYVDDFARVAARRVLEAEAQNEIIEAIGPETFTYRQIVGIIAQAIGVRRPIISVPPAAAYWACRMLGFFLRDVVITRQEIRGLMQGKLCVNAPPLGTTKLTHWAGQHCQSLGRRYASEMARRVDRNKGYSRN